MLTPPFRLAMRCCPHGISSCKICHKFKCSIINVIISRKTSKIPGFERNAPKFGSEVTENAGFLKFTGRSIRLSTLSTLEKIKLSRCMSNSVTKSNTSRQLLWFVLFTWINGQGLYGNFKYDLVETQQIDIWEPLSPSCWLSMTVTYILLQAH